MKRKINAAILPFLLFFLAAVSVSAETVTTSWGGDAEMVYDTGFMHMLMKHPGGGVSLFNMELTANEAPGAGRSEKGVTSDAVWGENRQGNC